MLYQRILLSDRMFRDKKEAMSLLHRAGIQFPGALIPRDGFRNSICDPQFPVKKRIEKVAQSTKFKR